MGSFGPAGEPPCELCRELPSVYHRDGEGLLCNRCLQSFENTRRAEEWSTIFRRHPVLREQIITFSVAEYLWGDGIDAYCRCGECSSSWFLKRLDLLADLSTHIGLLRSPMYISMCVCSSPGLHSSVWFFHCIPGAKNVSVF